MNLNYYKNVLVFSLVVLFSCKQSTNKITVDKDNRIVSLNSIDYIDTIGTIKVSEKSIITISEKSSLSYNIEIPVAGRYKFEINCTSNSEDASLWLEDYIENKDSRTYNVTGKIKLVKGENIFSKDGSPLNKGIHKMRLHIEGAKVEVNSFNFSLLKEHLKTPIILTQNMNGDNWEIVWSDEFDEEGSLDTSKWTYDIGNWGWGNNELQYYTENRLENARQENGNLIIEARKNDMGEEWTSARLTTRGKVTFLFGRIEFKAKVPPEKGNWAAGWTLGDEYVDEISWPYCGEIDILESVGYEMNDTTGNGVAHASAHCGAYYFKLGNQPTGTIEVENMNNEYHIYAVDWSPEGIIASVDGKEYFEYNDTTTALSWPFDKPQNIILNLAMGGGWGGLQGMDESVTSQKIYVDYVRVYQRK